MRLVSIVIFVFLVYYIYTAKTSFCNYEYDDQGNYIEIEAKKVEDCSNRLSDSEKKGNYTHCVIIIIARKSMDLVYL